MAEAVKVVVRCRPMNGLEKGKNCTKIVEVSKEILQIGLVSAADSDKEPKQFTFDGVYDDDSTQREVYEETAYPLVTSVMDGFNGTIFAYGQTGCGKTHTMQGVLSIKEQRGIIPQTFDQIFDTINNNSDAKKKYLVSCSFFEIYNEEVKDLLGNTKEPLEVKEDKEKGFYVKGLVPKVVGSADEMMALMDLGNSTRTVGATIMNATSSRSHSIFTIYIETSEPSDLPTAKKGDEKIKAGKLNLVDLAGSERQSKTQAEGTRLKEANNINLSLSALGNVIEALVKGKPHVPYRNSKLTKLLADSLGGNTKTVMIAAVSPADYNYDETLSTLRYANRAKNIKNKPKINEDPKDALLRQYQDEIKALKAMLEGAGIAGAVPALPAAPSGGMSAMGAAMVQQMQALSGPSPEVQQLVQRKDEEAKKLQAELESFRAEKEQHRKRAQELEQLLAAEKQAAGLSGKEREDFLAKLAQTNAAAQQLQQQQQEAGSGSTSAPLSLDASALQAQLKAEAERAAQLESSMAQKVAEEEYRVQQLEEAIQTKEEERAAEQQALHAKLAQLEKLVLEGGQKVQDSEAKRVEKERQAKEKIKLQKQKAAELREQRKKVEEEKLLIEEKYQSVSEEVDGLRSKCRALRKKYKAQLEENKDLTEAFDQERESYADNLRELYRELALHKRICDLFLQKQDLDKIVKLSTYDEDKDAWVLPPVELPVVFPKIAGQTSGPHAPPGAPSGGRRGSVMSATNGRPNSRRTGEEEAVEGPWGRKNNVREDAMRDIARMEASGAASNYGRPPRKLTNSEVSPRSIADVPAPQRVNFQPGKTQVVAESKTNFADLPRARANFEPARFVLDQEEKRNDDINRLAPENLPKPQRANFQPASVSPSNGTNGALAPSLLDGPQLPRRANFDPRHGSFDGDEHGPGPALAADVRTRGAFKPGAVGDAHGYGDNDPLANLPRSNRPAFGQDGGMNMPQDRFSAPVHASDAHMLQNLPPAKSFQPAGFGPVGGLGGGGGSLDLHSLPQGKTFQPAMGMGMGAGASPKIIPATTLGADDDDAGLILSSLPPSRPAFKPGGLQLGASDEGRAGSDVLRHAPPPRASFQPGQIRA